MSQPVVVVTFYSRGGDTERLATAAAVGAVQARAGIRMRRLAEVDLERTRQQYPEHRQHVDRMLREYVPPKEADLAAADALVVGTPPDLAASSGEWAAYFAILERLKSEGKLSGKAAAVVGGGPSQQTMVAALDRLGLTVVASTGGGVDQAINLGRDVVATAQSLRAVPR